MVTDVLLPSKAQSERINKLIQSAMAGLGSIQTQLDKVTAGIAPKIFSKKEAMSFGFDLDWDNFLDTDYMKVTPDSSMPERYRLDVLPDFVPPQIQAPAQIAQPPQPLQITEQQGLNQAGIVPGTGPLKPLPPLTPEGLAGSTIGGKPISIQQIGTPPPLAPIEDAMPILAQKAHETPMQTTRDFVASLREKGRTPETMGWLSSNLTEQQIEKIFNPSIPIEQLYPQTPEEIEQSRQNLAGIREIGRTPEAEAALREQFPDLTDQELENIFNSNITLEQLFAPPPLERELPRLLSEAIPEIHEGNLDVMLDFYGNNPEQLREAILRQGRNQATEAFVRYVHPDAVDEQIDEYFNTEPELGGITTEGQYIDKGFFGNLWEQIGYATPQVINKSMQYLTTVLPAFMFPDVQAGQSKISGISDERAQREGLAYTPEEASLTNQWAREKRDIFRAIATEKQAEHEEWLAKHKELEPPAYYKEGPFKHPDLWTNAGYWGATIGESLPFTLGVLATVLGTTFVTKNPMIGIAAGTAFATPYQSQDLYDDLVASGAPEGEAAKIAVPVGAVIASVEAVTDLPLVGAIFQPLKLFGKQLFKELGKRTTLELIKRGIKTFSIVEIVEVLEEIVQGAIQNAFVQEYDKDRAIFENIDTTIGQTLIATAPFALFGGAMSTRSVRPAEAVKVPHSQKQSEGWVKDEMTGVWYKPAPIMDIYTDAKAEARKGGLNAKEAKLKALNEVARTPEGEQIISEKADEIRESVLGPSMMTNKMQTQLKDLGYDEAAINKMKPQEAWDIINKPQEPTTPTTRATETPVEAPEVVGGGITPNMPESYVQAKKRPDGKWQLFFTGTRNEVFPNELFASTSEAKMAFRVAKAKLATPTPTAPITEPVAPVEGVAPEDNARLLEMSRTDYYRLKNGQVIEAPSTFPASSKTFTLEELRQMPTDTIITGKYYGAKRGGVARHKLKVGDITLPVTPVAPVTPEVTAPVTEPSMPEAVTPEVAVEQQLRQQRNIIQNDIDRVIQPVRVTSRSEALAIPREDFIKRGENYFDLRKLSPQERNFVDRKLAEIERVNAEIIKEVAIPKAEAGLQPSMIEGVPDIKELAEQLRAKLEAEEAYKQKISSVEAEMEVNRKNNLEAVTTPRQEGEIPRQTVRHPSHYRGMEDFNVEVKRELLTAIPESPLDVAATEYLESGDISKYIKAMPDVSELKLAALTGEVHTAVEELTSLRYLAVEEVTNLRAKKAEALEIKYAEETVEIWDALIDEAVAKQDLFGGFIDKAKRKTPLTVDDAVALGIALRRTRGGKLIAAVRRSGFYVTEEFVSSPHLQNVPYQSGFWQDIDTLFESIDGGRAAGTPSAPAVAQKYIQRPSQRNFLAYKGFLNTYFKQAQDMFERFGLVGRISKQKWADVFNTIEQITAKEADFKTAQLLRNTEIRDILAKYDTKTKTDIVEFAQWSRAFLDEMRGFQNQARVKRDQKEIGYIDKYMAWVAERNIWSTLGFSKRTPADMQVKAPAPDYIFPDAPFNARAMTREGGMKNYILEKNVHKLLFDYIRTAGKDIFFTNTVQNNKIHIAALRAKGFNSVAQLLEEYNAEAWAGAKPRLTKAYEAFLPSKIVKATYIIRRQLTRAVFPLNWIWNITIQPSSLAFTTGRAGLINTFRGLDFLFRPSARAFTGDTYSYIIKSKRSGKMAFQDIGQQVEESLQFEGSFIDKAEYYASYITNLIESLLTGVSVRAGYYKGMKLGFRGRELVEYASKMGAKTQSMYNFENVPAVLRSKAIGTLFPFQTFTIQAMNYVREMNYVRVGKAGAYETISATSADGKATISGRLKLTAAFLITILVINMAIDRFTNRKPWILSSFIPMFSILGAGFEPGDAWNLPLPIKYVNDFWRSFNDAIKYDDFTKLRRWMLTYHFFFGGSQINRMLDGVEAVVRGEVTDARGREKFEVRKDEWFKAIFMGPYQTEGGREYIDRLDEKNEKKAKWYEYLDIPLLIGRVDINSEIEDNLAKLGEVDEDGMRYDFGDFASAIRDIRQSVGQKRFDKSVSPILDGFKKAEVARENYENLPPEKLINMDEYDISDFLFPESDEKDAEITALWTRFTTAGTKEERLEIIKEYIEVNKEALKDNKLVENYGLLEDYWSLIGRDKAAFAEKYDILTKNWRYEWRGDEPESDALLAMWGYGGKIQTQEAYDYIIKLSEEYGVDPAYLSTWLPPEDVVPTHFARLDAVADFGANSAEAQLILAQDRDDNDSKYATWADLTVPDKPVRYYELKVETRTEREYEDRLKDKDDLYVEDTKERMAALRKEFGEDTKYYDKQYEAEALAGATLSNGDFREGIFTHFPIEEEANTHLASWIEYKQKSAEFDDAGPEAHLVLANDPEMTKWAGLEAPENPTRYYEIKSDKDFKEQDKFWEELGKKKGADGRPRYGDSTEDTKAKEAAFYEEYPQTEVDGVMRSEYFDNFKRTEALSNNQEDGVIIEQFVDMSRKAREFGGGSREVRLYKLQNSEMFQWLIDEEEAKPAGHGSEWARDVLELQVTWGISEDKWDAYTADGERYLGDSAAAEKLNKAAREGLEATEIIDDVTYGEARRRIAFLTLVYNQEYNVGLNPADFLMYADEYIDYYVNNHDTTLERKTFLLDPIHDGFYKNVWLNKDMMGKKPVSFSKQDAATISIPIQEDYYTKMMAK